MMSDHSIDSSWSFSFFDYLRFKIYQLISNFEYFFVLFFKSHHFTKKTGHYKYLYWILRKITVDDFMSFHHLKIKISRHSNLGIQIYLWSSWYCLLNLYGFFPNFLVLNSTKELAELNLDNSFARIPSDLYITVSRPKLTVFLLSLGCSWKFLKLYKK